MIHRLLISYDVTDELFGICISVPGKLSPYYAFGAYLMALPGWSLGSAMGTLMGSVLPANVVSALSVSLFGMFLAIIIPPAKKDKVVAALIILAFALSWAASVFAPFSDLSEGTRTIILTVAISGGAAVLFPISTKGENHHDA